ncbi:LegC family aminotransferase [Paenibacillus thiaminolyticus]|uniref:LegC family aminotransferase n=1 Tax=Paenibacillus thiaminolyticus TaxID=49283 RepID=A0AAP9DUQ6_PANTH|nr:LegC family aminotransferase [Paenibacillus thiaminolyticus]MCY9536768.1 LegC family aminotransferase [Paenibacillus thiaminolyticus]MCY9604016.1 LegC family aminotransferase [Paenibacillus thiaminolyticus]MCY9609158.1 LegC family aminotransferase [Paenibacillus thiaminolyticus]MCY9612244.1 LegC family aminotransferase [Paenibacillus thiaminolyticus]MCY9621768.1 LegC family aminotransferase [Paenibacillus thiaminolyticus]
MIVNDIINKLSELLPQQSGVVALHEPRFQGEEWNYVKDCLDSGWVSSVGSYVSRFERDLADYLGAKHAVAVVNGTAALHVSLLLAGVQEKDEVLIPSLSFVATANAVAYCHALPHFIDVSAHTLGVDSTALEDYLTEIAEVREGICYNRKTGNVIRAVVPMHTFGHPADMDPLIELCAKFHIVCVEDAAESLGSTYKSQHCGTIGSIGAFSFNGNKIMTTGGGGAIVTNDENIARRAKHITTTAKQPHPWNFVHTEVGYNYRLPNINAALGCAQLEYLPRLIEAKRRLAMKYQTAFESIEGVSIFQEKPYAKSNYWLNAIVLKQPDELLRESILQMTNKKGFMTRPIWTPLHKLSMYEQMPKMPLKVTESLQNQIINIPSSPHLTGEIYA